MFVLFVISFWFHLGCIYSVLSCLFYYYTTHKYNLPQNTNISTQLFFCFVMDLPKAVTVSLVLGTVVFAALFIVWCTTSQYNANSMSALMFGYAALAACSVISLISRLVQDGLLAIKSPSSSPSHPSSSSIAFPPQQRQQLRTSFQTILVYTPYVFLTMTTAYMATMIGNYFTKLANHRITKTYNTLSSVFAAFTTFQTVLLYMFLNGSNSISTWFNTESTNNNNDNTDNNETNGSKIQSALRGVQIPYQFFLLFTIMNFTLLHNMGYIMKHQVVTQG